MKARILWNDLKGSPLLAVTTWLFMAVSAFMFALTCVLAIGLLGSVDTLMEAAQTPDFLQMHAGEINEKELVRFAGEHEEGGLGLLYVHPDVRRKGIGESLEAYVVNRHLALGYTPYGQIVVGNDKSINLQEKHGLYLSEGHVWWMD